MKADPRTMTARKARESIADELRKPMDCMSRNRDGGPYRGNSGNRGCVLEGGIALRRDASGLVDCVDPA